MPSTGNVAEPEEVVRRERRGQEEEQQEEDVQRVDPPNQPLLLRGLPAPLLRVIILLLSQLRAEPRRLPFAICFLFRRLPPRFGPRPGRAEGTGRARPRSLMSRSVPTRSVTSGIAPRAPQLMCARLPRRFIFCDTFFLCPQTIVWVKLLHRY